MFLCTDVCVLSTVLAVVNGFCFLNIFVLFVVLFDSLVCNCVTSIDSLILDDSKFNILKYGHFKKSNYHNRHTCMSLCFPCSQEVNQSILQTIACFNLLARFIFNTAYNGFFKFYYQVVIQCIILLIIQFCY